MERVATRRLVDAAAELEPADRALVALWVHHGFDDGTLAGITGIAPEAIATRRVRLVERLSAILGLPPDDIVEAFTTLGPDEPTAAEELTAADEPTAVAAPADADETVTAGAPGAPAQRVSVSSSVEGPSATEAAPRSRRGRRRAPVWTVAPPLVALAAVIVVVILATSNGATHHRRRVAPRPSPPSFALTRVQPLTPLAGGSAGASGTVGITHANGHLELKLTVTGLPALTSGRYEVWLYNSIIDSQSLGFLPGPSGALAVHLPSSASRYRFIDVEHEPPGDVNPSGESVLRANNPV